jgi:prophage maintenance system killer protein
MRIALVVMVAFLDRNGIKLTASNAEALEIMLAVASGGATEPDFAACIDRHSRARPE